MIPACYDDFHFFAMVSPTSRNIIQCAPLGSIPGGISDNFSPARAKHCMQSVGGIKRQIAAAQSPAAFVERLGFGPAQPFISRPTVVSAFYPRAAHGAHVHLILVVYEKIQGRIVW